MNHNGSFLVQTIRSSRSHRWLLGLLMAAATAEAQMPAAPVQTATAVEREVRTGRTLVATVLANRSSEIGSDAAGIAVQVLAQEGDRVTSGQPLVRIRSRDLELSIAAESAELALRREELAELLAGTRSEEIAQARARVKAAEAEIPYREWRVEQSKTLVTQKTGSEDTHRQDVFNHLLAQAQLAQATALLEWAMAGPRAEVIAQARARVLVQEEKLRRMADELDRYVVRAPFGGHITSEHVELGQWIARGGSVFSIAELETLEVVVDVPESDIGRIRRGSTATVRVDAYPDRLYFGEVTAIVPRADLKSRTFPVKLRVLNQEVDGDISLREGMFARVTLPLGAANKAVIIPKDALVLGGPSPVVFVVEAGEGGAFTVKPIPVQPGIPSGSWIAVEGGVKAGQKVVVLGNERIRPGQSVSIAGEVAAPE